MGRLLPLLLVVAGSGALAAETMTPQAFEAASTGRVMHFSLNGQYFGSEQYFPGRRVIWRFGDGSCQPGRWWAEGPLICFFYEGGEAPQCWAFHPRPGGFAASLVEDGVESGLVLELAGTDTAPLACPGPDVGS